MHHITGMMSLVHIAVDNLRNFRQGLEKRLTGGEAVDVGVGEVVGEVGEIDEGEVVVGDEEVGGATLSSLSLSFGHPEGEEGGEGSAPSSWEKVQVLALLLNLVTRRLEGKG